MNTATEIIRKSASLVCSSGGCGTNNINDVFVGITNTLIFLLGSISVIMIIIAGLRYVLSNGDPKAVEGAKNTILYSVIGIIVAIASYAIVKFVATNIK